MSVMLLQILFLVASASALTVPHGALRSSTLRMQAPSAADVATETVGVVAPTSTGSAEMWQLKVKAAQERAKVVKAEQDATIGAMATGAIGLFFCQAPSSFHSTPSSQICSFPQSLERL